VPEGIIPRRACARQPQDLAATRRERAANAILASLAVSRVLSAARAELLELQPVRIVPPVLFSVVCPLLAIGASERHEQSIGFLRHLGASSVFQ
jgi:hypothetical protein